MHAHTYHILAGLTIRLNLLQCSVKEVRYRGREKGNLHLLKYRTKEGEKSWIDTGHREDRESVDHN